jgi:hypothetical protein
LRAVGVLAPGSVLEFAHPIVRAAVYESIPEGERAWRRLRLQPAEQPHSAELLANGHVLIADENNNRVIEATRSHHIVWQYGSLKGTQLSGAAFASRLPGGHTLITDSNNNRILTVTHDKKIAFSYATKTRPGSMAMPLPTRAVMLKTGNILISDQFNDQVTEINQHKQIVVSQGKIQVDGNGFNLPNAPYDAKVIGDYTGLTPPSGFGH